MSETLSAIVLDTVYRGGIARSVFRNDTKTRSNFQLTNLAAWSKKLRNNTFPANNNNPAMLNFLGWIIFAVISYSLLTMIIAACTNRKFRAWAVIVLIVFSIASGYLMFIFDLHRAFLIHIVVFVLLLINLYRKIVRNMNDMAGLDSAPNRQAAIAELDLEMSETGVNYRGTKLMLILSSITYLALFCVSYLYFYNTDMIN